MLSNGICFTDVLHSGILSSGLCYLDVFVFEKSLLLSNICCLVVFVVQLSLDGFVNQSVSRSLLARSL